MSSAAQSFISQLEEVAAGKELNIIQFENLLENISTSTAAVEEPEEYITPDPSIFEPKEDENVVAPIDIEPLPIQENKSNISIEKATLELESLFEGLTGIAVVEETSEEEIPKEVEDVVSGEDLFKEQINYNEPLLAEADTQDLEKMFEKIAGIDIFSDKKSSVMTSEVINIPAEPPEIFDISTTITSIIGDASEELHKQSKSNGVDDAAKKILEDTSYISDTNWQMDLFANAKNAQMTQVVSDVANLLEKHKGGMPDKEYKILEGDAVKKTSAYLSKMNLPENHMPFTGTALDIAPPDEWRNAITGIVRKMIATGPGSGEVWLKYLDDVDTSNITATDKFLAWDASVSKFVASAGGAAGDITGVTAGTGLSGGGDTGTVTLDLDVSELTALGTTAALTDYVVIQDVTDNSTKKVLVSNLPGDITGVTAGTGLNGGGIAGDVTINLDPVTVALGGTGLITTPQGSVIISNTADTISALDGSTAIVGTDIGYLSYDAGTDTVNWLTDIDGGSY